MDKKNASVGYRSHIHRSSDGGRVTCEHGNVCLEYVKRTGKILSCFCPYDCSHYKPLTLPSTIQ